MASSKSTIAVTDNAFKEFARNAVEGAYEYLNAEVPEIIAIPDDDLWADIKNIKDLTGAVGKRSFGGSLRSKSKYMNQQEPTYKIETAIRNTAHGLVCRVSIMGKLIIKETPVTNFDGKKPEFLDVTQAIYLEAYGAYFNDRAYPWYGPPLPPPPPPAPATS